MNEAALQALLFPTVRMPAVHSRASGEICLYACNIQNPGAKRAKQIASKLFEIRPELLILTEVKEKPATSFLLQELAAFGYQLSYDAGGQDGYFTVMASLFPFKPLRVETPAIRGRVNICAVEAPFKQKTYIVGVYGITCGPQTLDRRPDFQRIFKESVLHRLSASGQRTIVLGDLNIMEEKFHGAQREGLLHSDRVFYSFFDALGFSDIIRRAYPDTPEYTWFSPIDGRGQRLDHAFATKDVLSCITRAEVDHSFRKDGYSDHSALRLTLSSQLPSPSP